MSHSASVEAHIHHAVGVVGDVPGSVDLPEAPDMIDDNSTSNKSSDIAGSPPNLLGSSAEDGAPDIDTSDVSAHINYAVPLSADIDISDVAGSVPLPKA